jgi:hypothetical protein
MVAGHLPMTLAGLLHPFFAVCHAEQKETMMVDFEHLGEEGANPPTSSATAAPAASRGGPGTDTRPGIRPIPDDEPPPMNPFLGAGGAPEPTFCPPRGMDALMLDVPQINQPLLSIWFRPRDTMRWFLANYSPSYVICLLFAAGFASTLPELLQSGLAIPIIILTAALLGGIGMLIQSSVSAWLLLVTGRVLGGQGTWAGIIAGMAWAQVPTIFLFMLLLPMQALVGVAPMAGAETLPSTAIGVNAGLLIIQGLASIVVGIWALVIGLKCLGEAQGFSAWAALGNFILAGLLGMGLLLLLAAVMVGVMFATGVGAN